MNLKMILHCQREKPKQQMYLFVTLKDNFQDFDSRDRQLSIGVFFRAM